MSKQNDSIAAAEQIVADLETKRGRLLDRGKEIGDRIAALGFRVHAENDKAARSELDKLSTEAAVHQTKTKSLEAAIKQAEQKLEVARSTLAREQQKANAASLAKVIERIDGRPRRLDDYLAKAMDEIVAWEKDIGEIHALSGGGFPTYDQFRVNGLLALKTSMMELPASWRRDFENLAPNQRTSWGQFWSRMREPLKAGVANILNEKTERAA